jgi:hypothetical protein
MGASCRAPQSVLTPVGLFCALFAGAAGSPTLLRRLRRQWLWTVWVQAWPTCRSGGPPGQISIAPPLRYAIGQSLHRSYGIRRRCASVQKVFVLAAVASVEADQCCPDEHAGVTAAISRAASLGCPGSGTAPCSRSILAAPREGVGDRASRHSACADRWDW